MPGQRRDNHHARLLGLDILLEMQERAERRHMRRLFPHLDVAVAHGDMVDAERRPAVSEPCAGDQFVGRREVADGAVAGHSNAEMAERAGCHPRQHPHRTHDIRLGLIGRVQHSQSPAVSQPPGTAETAPSQCKKTSAFPAALRDNFFGHEPVEALRGSGMAKATLAIASKNYGSWSLRGWLLCRMAGLEFDEVPVSSDDPSTRAELLLLSPSFLVPCLTHDGVKVWDTLAIGEYLHELTPDAGLLPADRAARARCRSISGEMHSGFSNLRSALPMNLKAHYKGYRIFAGAQPDIERVVTIWRECLKEYGGPFLFGAKPCMADAMFAPVCTRFTTYDVRLDAVCAAYSQAILALPFMQEWIVAARTEPEELEELDVEF